MAPRPRTLAFTLAALVLASGAALARTQPRTIFLNKAGGVYSPGDQDDSVRNISALLEKPAEIPPFHLGDARWAELRQCVERAFGPYAVTITDVEPPEDEDYIEIVVGGTSEDTHRPADVGGTSFTPPGCGVSPRGVGFAYAARFGDDVQQICVKVVHEAGHNLGLDHVMNACDPMTYLKGCTIRGFPDKEARCGEFTPRRCQCGRGTRQNSHRFLLATVGPADHTPPTVAIKAPKEGEAARGRFEIRAEARDTNRIWRVELFIDGERYGELYGEKVRWKAPEGLSPGEHTLEVVAHDGGGNTARASRTVRVIQCRNNADCTGGQICREGSCLTWTPPQPAATATGQRDDEAEDKGCRAVAGRGPTPAPAMIFVLLLAAGIVRFSRYFR